MADKHDPGQIAVLVHTILHEDDSDPALAELASLASSAGVTQQIIIKARRHVPDARYFVGHGKAEEIAQAVHEHCASLVIFNHDLSPAQERNLERLVHCHVIDRTRLILDIFALRARTFEGKLQVELAQLQHLSTRLVRGWSHLERQKGGIGLRGPGETQLETDRRLVRVRIKKIKERLDKVRTQRELGRSARQRADIPVVSLVGYTNAGKSTLFNMLTAGEVYAADQLFATLDPTLRRVEFIQGHPLIMVDTVGFIRHLPHSVVDAFWATLEETQRANLLLHVCDASSTERQLQQQQVTQVLEEIGAKDVPTLVVYNKIDQDTDWSPKIERDEQGLPKRVYISALQGIGLDLLREAISEHLFGQFIQREICLSVKQARLRSQLHAARAVLQEKVDEQGNWLLLVRLPLNDFKQLKRYL